MRFHARPDFGTFTSASQVQLDVRYDELIRSSDEYLGDYEPSQEIREKYDFE